MSKPANKTLIGAFVVGATALLLLAIAVFGSGKLFQTTSRYVLFFDGSISGLSVGSPVLFRGVPVGRVVEIRLTGNLDTKGASPSPTATSPERNTLIVWSATACGQRWRPRACSPASL